MRYVFNRVVRCVQPCRTCVGVRQTHTKTAFDRRRKQRYTFMITCHPCGEISSAFLTSYNASFFPKVFYPIAYNFCATRNHNWTTLLVCQMFFAPGKRHYFWFLNCPPLTPRRGEPLFGPGQSGDSVEQRNIACTERNSMQISGVRSRQTPWNMTGDLHSPMHLWANIPREWRNRCTVTRSQSRSSLENVRLELPSIAFRYTAFSNARFCNSLYSLYIFRAGWVYRACRSVTLPQVIGIRRPIDCA